MKNKNNNQNEFERLVSQRSGGGGIYPPYPPPWIRHWMPIPAQEVVILADDETETN